MAGLPGSIPSMLPAGQDELVRRMRDLERRVDELGPSVAKSFLPTLATVIVPDSRLDTQALFAITTTETTFSTVTFTIPAGYTKAAFVYTATCWGTNHSGASASITLWPSVTSDAISNLYSAPSGPTLPDSTNVVTSSSVADTVSGLTPGHSLVFTTDASASLSGFGSDTGAQVGVMVLWMR